MILCKICNDDKKRPDSDDEGSNWDDRISFSDDMFNESASEIYEV